MRDKRITELRMLWCMIGVVLPILVIGCGTPGGGLAGAIDYAQVQAQFQKSVEADNIGSVSSVKTESSAARTGYLAVIRQLSPSAIGSLDPQLQEGAWLLRAFSEYRTGQLSEALASASKGRSEPGSGSDSRDRVLLTLMPALVIDAEIFQAWKGTGERFSESEYGLQAKNFGTVFDTWDETWAAVGRNTSHSCRNYVLYQKWRMLQNWRTAINTMDASPAVQSAAMRHAEGRFGGRRLKEVATETKGMIPSSDPFSDLFASQEGS